MKKSIKWTIFALCWVFTLILFTFISELLTSANTINNIVGIILAAIMGGVVYDTSGFTKFKWSK